MPCLCCGSVFSKFDTDTTLATRELEDTLPLTALVSYVNLGSRKIAIYTLLTLKATQLEQLQQNLRDANDINYTEVAVPAARTHFSSLLDTYNYHVRIEDPKSFYHPLYFIVADQIDWAEKGVFFVNLEAIIEQRDSFVGVQYPAATLRLRSKSNLTWTSAIWTGDRLRGDKSGQLRW